MVGRCRYPRFELDSCPLSCFELVSLSLSLEIVGTSKSYRLFITASFLYLFLEEFRFEL